MWLCKARACGRGGEVGRGCCRMGSGGGERLCRQVVIRGLGSDIEMVTGIGKVRDGTGGEVVEEGEAGGWGGIDGEMVRLIISGVSH